mmetsp:Transcript_30009/g.32310  ORF Transcript_30009/g.32310 Transcript_30009/m.32310 type:complete len:105 (-) Transcript_30009:359-673(-)
MNNFLCQQKKEKPILISKVDYCTMLLRCSTNEYIFNMYHFRYLYCIFPFGVVSLKGPINFPRLCLTSTILDPSRSISLLMGRAFREPGPPNLRPPTNDPISKAN